MRSEIVDRNETVIEPRGKSKMRLMLKALLNDIYGITIDKQKSRKPCIFLPRLKRRKTQNLILGPEMQAKKKVVFVRS